MSYPELLAHEDLHDHWVAIDPAGGPAGRPRGGIGGPALRSGAVVVDHDAEIDALCARISAAQKTSLHIVYCGTPA